MMSLQSIHSHHHAPANVTFAHIDSLQPEEVIEWGYSIFGETMIMTTSFGAESAVMLHMATRTIRDLKIVFIDTGFLFPETYRFMRVLRDRFNLDLRIFVPSLTPACLEALHGRLWEQEGSGRELYQHLTRVEPMNRALEQLNARAWIAGLRREQTPYRAQLRKIERQGSVFKLCPILDWTEEDVRGYMHKHDLPYHPLYAQGYRSIGEVHSTQPTPPGQDARAGRSLGKDRECGLHTSHIKDASAPERVKP